MTKPSQVHGVEAEKAEAMRKYNNQKRFRNILRAAAAALLTYLWFPTVAISLQAAGGWLYRTGEVLVTNRTFVFVFANILVGFIFLLSRDRNDEESTSVSCSTEPDLYDQYTSSSAVIAFDEKVVDDGDSKKKIVPAFIAEVDEVVVADKQIVPAFVDEAVRTDSKGSCMRKKSETELRRTESERKKDIKRPVTEFRRSESANSGIERLNSEEFRLTIEAFIMKRKKCLVQEKHDDVVASQEYISSGLELVGADSGYGSYVLTRGAEM